MVGGALRDRLLGNDHRDADYATDALPDVVEEIAAALDSRTVTIGRRFGTISLQLGEAWVEITTFRGDSYKPGVRWPDVTFGTSIEEDLARRDFTCNALAQNMVTGEQLDPFHGASDIEGQILRAVGDPAARFREDPLRILRGFRFSSQLGFEIEAETLAAMGEASDLLAQLSHERVTGELDGLLLGSEPSRGLRALAGTGSLAVVLPELGAAQGCEQNRFHRFDVWEHTVATVEAIVVGSESARIRRWSALVHDIGKPAVRHRKPNGEWGFYRHETVGSKMVADLMERLHFARREAQVIELLVRRHMDRPQVDERSSVRRFMHRARGAWRDLHALKVADNASHTYSDREYHESLRKACETIEKEEAEALRAESPLSGDDLIEIFGQSPGPWIGEMKRRLSAMVLDGDLAPGDRAAAEQVVRDLISRR